MRYQLLNGIERNHIFECLKPVNLLSMPRREWQGEWPTVSVAVYTRNRVEELARCLEALSAVDYSKLELFVIDNAPSSQASERLVQERFPSVRYVREDRPGLDWARNRAIDEATGEILTYTDG